MQRVIKAKALNEASVDATVDIGLINRYSMKDLTPEDVFAFSVILCSNEIDRDNEQFTDSCLEGLAPLFVGKAGIFNHSRNAKDQIARIYRAVVEDGEGKNAVGQQIRHVKAFAYIPRSDYTNETISKIESGILREVSVGVNAGEPNCSICGSGFRWWSDECSEGHRKGLRYEEGLCYGVYKEAKDAYEFSFVAVPAQRAAGVTKGVDGSIESAVEALAGADLTEYPEICAKLNKMLDVTRLSAEDQKKRKEIMAENKKYLGGNE